MLSLKLFFFRHISFQLLVLLIFASIAVGQEVPKLQGRVNDMAGMLSPTTISQLENSLTYFEQEDSTQLVILTIVSLEGENLEEFSLRVAETWKIGQKHLDNGALLLVVKKERKIRIEVGYGLEGSLTDLLAGRIIRNIITPRFKEGNFDQGILDGISAMMAAVKGEFKAKDIAKSSKGVGDIEGFITMLLFFFFFLGNLLRKNKGVAVAIGGVGAPLLGTIFLGFTWALLAGLVPLGIIGGYIASLIFSSTSHRRGGVSWGAGGGFSGGSSGGFGGFSGGGGSFGGGGSSGGW